MITRKSTSMMLSACSRCGGDAYLDATDEPEWRCLQCGRLVARTKVASHSIIGREQRTATTPQAA